MYTTNTITKFQSKSSRPQFFKQTSNRSKLKHWFTNNFQTIYPSKNKSFDAKNGMKNFLKIGGKEFISSFCYLVSHEWNQTEAILSQVNANWYRGSFVSRWAAIPFVLPSSRRPRNPSCLPQPPPPHLSNPCWD